MKTPIRFLAATTLAINAFAEAQFIKGSEAVRVLPDGTRKVATPPLPATGIVPFCSADQSGCEIGGWRIAETRRGLWQCTATYARPGACRASTYGLEKQSSVWIVKFPAQRMQCLRPGITGPCASTKVRLGSEVQ